jgi:hypothetical protein
VTDAEELAEAYRRAERRLQELLFGDGVYTPGLVRGEEGRDEVTSALRRMRNAFAAALAENEEGRAEKAETRNADLEEELRRIAVSRSLQRFARKARGERRPKHQAPSEAGCGCTSLSRLPSSSPSMSSSCSWSPFWRDTLSLTTDYPRS